MKRIWNTFCEDISNNIGVKEMTFEKEIVKGFLQALGWSRYDGNLEEQHGLYGRKWIPDFIFYLNNDKNAKEIILELKKPDHKQRKVDIEQIEAYMKLTDCRFGLYFGEKLEVFYLQERDGKRSAASVATIEWTIDNAAGINLIQLLNFKTYNRETLEQYCFDNVYMNAFLRHCKHPGGVRQLYDCIMEHFSLPESMADCLRSRLKFNVVDIAEIEEASEIPAPQTQPKAAGKPKLQHDKTQYSINGGAFEGKRRFVYRLVKTYMEQHPVATFADLERVFDPMLQGGYGVIRTLDYIREKGYEEYRYFMKPDELLRSADGKVFAVCSQWGIGNTPRVVEFAKQLGYKITTTGEAPKTIIKSSGLISCVLTRNANAKGVFDTATQTLTVLKGSTINPGCVDKIKPATKATRDAQVAKFAERRGNELVVVKDAVFDSPSGAAVFCVGGASNGWRDWKDENNNMLDIYRK